MTKVEAKEKRLHLVDKAEAKSHCMARNKQPKAQLVSSRSVGGRPKEARLKLMHEGGLYS